MVLGECLLVCVMMIKGGVWECLVVCVMMIKGGVGGMFGCLCDDD